VGRLQHWRCKYDSSSPAEAAVSKVAPSPLRARGEARAVFSRIGATSRPARVFESGGLRLRFPKAVGPCEAVLINTGGGMAGGDRALVELELESGADVLATTQSAEKIYRSEGEAAKVETRLALAEGARLAWTPQETILFESARLERRLEADVAEGAWLLLIESAVFGRLAMGEDGIEASFKDRWRIRRGGRLVFADALRIDNAAAALRRPAVGRDARAIASFLFMAPEAAAHLERIRGLFDEIAARSGAPLEAAASALDGFIVARALSPDPARLRSGVLAVMMALTNRAAPRVWQ
jgi:urease accessory protein